MFKGLHCNLAFSERAAVQWLSYVLCIARYYDILDSNFCIGNWFVFSRDRMKYVRNEFFMGGWKGKQVERLGKQGKIEIK